MFKLAKNFSILLFHCWSIIVISAL